MPEILCRQSMLECGYKLGHMWQGMLILVVSMCMVGLRVILLVFQRLLGNWKIPNGTVY